MKILLVEDEVLMVEQLRLILRPIASYIASTDDLRRALQMAAADPFNVVVLDLKLINTGKAEALAAIPEFKRLGSAVVVVSGLPEPDLKEQVEAAGADAFVPKDSNFSVRAMMIATNLAVMKLPEHAFRSNTYQRHVDLLRRLANT